MIQMGAPASDIKTAIDAKFGQPAGGGHSHGAGDGHGH